MWRLADVTLSLVACHEPRRYVTAQHTTQPGLVANLLRTLHQMVADCLHVTRQPKRRGEAVHFIG
jgi:hypothetical protein